MDACAAPLREQEKGKVVVVGDEGALAVGDECALPLAVGQRLWHAPRA